MTSRLRVLLLGAGVSAAVSIIAGLWHAAGEIGSHDYLRQGLWRTALWNACRDSSLAANVGAAAGLLMALSLAIGPG